MPLADWNIGGSGSYSIVTDGTSPVTNTSVLKIPSNGSDLRFLNTTVGAITNSSIETWCRYEPTSNNAVVGMRLRLRGIGQAEPGSGGTLGDGLTARIIKLDHNSDPTDTLFTIRIEQCVSTTITTLDDLNFAVTSNLAWNKFRFSAYSTGGATFIRCEWWNGSTYVIITEMSTLNPTIYSSAAYAGLQIFPSGNGFAYFDDTAIYSLT